MSKYSICLLKSITFGTILITQVAATNTDKQWNAFGSIGFESDYVVSGVKAANESFQPNVEVSYNAFTAGIWSNLPLDNESGNFVDEHRIYAFWTFQPFDCLAIDAGGTHYSFPNDFSNPNRTNELNFLATFDEFLSPSFGFNYDFNLRQTELILAFEHEWSLEKLIRNLSLNASIAFGYLNAGDPDSDQTPGRIADSYLYIESILNIIYSVNDYSHISLGPRFATNNNGASRNIGGHETHLWWGASAAFSY